MYSNNALATSSGIGIRSSSSSRFGPQSQSTPEPATALADPSPMDANLAAMEGAKRSVTTSMSKDETAVMELDDTLGAAASGDYVVPDSDSWIPFTLLKSMKLPRAILSEVDGPDPRMAMGIMSEIDRAWIIINDILYLWDYLDGQANSVETYQKGTEAIIHVALVPVKTGVFVETITHLLVICRQTFIELVGISAPAGQAPPGSLPRRELTMFETDIKVPNEMAVESVVGSPEGRIFLCGKGPLFELEYRARESWFSRQAKLINHSISTGASFIPSVFASRTGDEINTLAFDQNRRCLYALTETMDIILFHVPLSQPTSVNRVAMLDHIASKARTMCPGSNLFDSKDFRIHSLYPIDASESKGIHLMAVTTSGVRLYFTHHRNRGYGYATYGAPDGPPNTLQLIHVRMPPNDVRDPLAPQNPRPDQQPAPPAPWVAQEIGRGAYTRGLFVTQEYKRDSPYDYLWCTAPNLPTLGRFSATPDSQPTPALPHKVLLSEVTCVFPIAGNVWAIAPNPAIPPVSMAMGWNETVTQFSGPPASFLVLTSSDMHIVARKRPVQTLLEVFEEYGKTQNGDAVNSFYKVYGQMQSPVMAMAIAAENTYIRPPELVYSPVALDAIMDGSVLAVSPINVNIKEYARAFLYEYGGTPVQNDPRYGYQSGPRFSARYEAFATYFSRLVRPIWKAKLTKGTVTNQTIQISPASLMSVQRDLERLKTFLAENPQMFLPGPVEYGSRQGVIASENDAWKINFTELSQAEHAAATQLQALLNQTVEAIEFVLLLNDYNMPQTVGKMEASIQQALFALTYEDFLTTKQGRETARNVVNAMINQQIVQQLSVDAISEILQQRCGSFCSADDVMLYKAQEQSIEEYRDESNAAATAGSEDKYNEFETTMNHIQDIALRSQDFVFHSYLYDWVITTEEPSTLIQLPSPFVEQYLLHEPRTRPKTELLWQFYVQNGRNMDAARTLAALAESVDFGLTLDERIQYLSLAISNAKSTSGDGLRRSETDGEFLSDLSDKLDVATVQLEIYARLTSAGRTPDQDPKLLALANSLLTISELYRDYAEPKEMYDIQLLILHTSEHHDTALVTSIWRAILDSYRDRVDHFTALSARVAELGRRFYPSEIAFPIEILSELLETYSLGFGNQAPPGWALRTLVEGNVPHEVVMDYFDRIKDSGVPPYLDPTAIRHVLDDITAFLGEWLDEVLRPGSRYAKVAFPAGKIEALVDHYLSPMRGMSNDPTKVKLQEIQQTLRKRF
ncbi:hypothetical protein FRB99_003175 [Tulasnella sp. 403]|nr:hypothetical protein FRB99_003175 [Tulasnella sp. 403]